MFKIIIKNLRLFGYHGINEKEKINGQEFLFNIVIYLNKSNFNRTDLNSDDIKNTVNYSEVISLVKKINNENKFNLLETFSQVLADTILSNCPAVLKVKVKIEKTSPPIKEKLDSVGVEFESDNFISSAYLSFGSNMGDKEKNLREAVNNLSKNSDIKICAISSIYETEPMYEKKQDYFYNIVLKVVLKETVGPFELLGLLKKIEYIMGRKNFSAKNGPRIIDMDILFYDDLEIASDLLTIPHPKLLERNFVLAPLGEISPGLKIQEQNINDYIKKCNFGEKVTRVKDWQKN
jgi:dihydroneopterin aldolase/2-amino-4-hydroxy-6-hydroxymethyldihydropteridine diphosphokinase